MPSQPEDANWLDVAGIDLNLVGYGEGFLARGEQEGHAYTEKCEPRPNIRHSLSPRAALVVIRRGVPAPIGTITI
jgi:hypothetical protein